MTSQPIRIGIVGAGANTCARHIPGLQAIEGVELVSVCNRRTESSRAVAGRFGIPIVYGTWQELVSSPDTDAILIGTWPYLHAPITLAALDARKHVLCEARMAMNAAEAREMLAAARHNPMLVTQVVPSPFTLEFDETIRDLLAQGCIGDVIAVDLRSFSGRFLDRNAPLTWRQDRSLSGNNMLTLGIWYEALMRWLGAAKHVLAAGTVFVPQRRDPLTGDMRTVEIPDHLDVTGRFRGGAPFHFLFASVCGPEPVNEIHVIGADGTLRFRNGVLQTARRGESAFKDVPIPPDKKGYWRVEEEFVNAIRGIEPVKLTTFEDGVRYMDFTDAVTRSLETGCRADVAEPV